MAMGRCFQTASGSLRWMVTVRPSYPKHTLVVVRLQPANDVIKDIVVLAAPPRSVKGFTLTDAMALSTGTTYPSAGAFVDAIVNKTSTPNGNRATKSQKCDTTP